jgi:hypothetical protein
VLGDDLLDGRRWSIGNDSDLDRKSWKGIVAAEFAQYNVKRVGPCVSPDGGA